MAVAAMAVVSVFVVPVGVVSMSMEHGVFLFLMQFRYIELRDISKLHRNGIQAENTGNCHF